MQLETGKEKQGDKKVTMKIGSRVFDTEHHSYIMGILNVTPDSFSDGGKWSDVDRAVRHAQDMAAEGAAIIDVGGESTRPGHSQISDEEEIARVVPCIEAIKRCMDIPVSIDSYKRGVIEAALKAGADMVNDIWGLKYDPECARLIARYDVPCCLMHNRRDGVYRDFLPDMLEDLRQTLAIAASAGIRKEQIILDPGIGFAKNQEQNLTAIRELRRLRELGFPVLLAVSKKSVIGNVLQLPAEQRVEGTVALSVIGVERGASFLRVHDVKENYRAIKMAEAVISCTGKEEEKEHETSFSG